MTGFTVFARKESQEILRTWRLWVLPGILVFFALTGPPLARYTPEIIKAFAGDQLGGLTLPPPTYLDAYGQWIKNLTQIALFALIIICGGIVSAESRSGTAVLVLTKPVSRTAFVVVKAVVNSAFVAVLLVVGTLITWGLTAAMFGSAPGSALWSSALVWLVLAVQFIAVMTLLSVLIGSAAGAAGAGLGVFVLLLDRSDLEAARVLLARRPRGAGHVVGRRHRGRTTVAGADVDRAVRRARRARRGAVPQEGAVTRRAEPGPAGACTAR